MRSRLVIGSRGSPLALRQSELVAEALRRAAPGIEVVIETYSTTGDRVLDSPLARIGSKGLFTKELEDALREKRADLAVHSLKDLPTDLPDGLILAAVPEREDPRDALVCREWGSLEELPAGVRVGTSSLRRAAQLRAHRPDLCIMNLRGNVNTRVRRVMEGALDAAVMACAGLVRSGHGHAIRQIFSEDIMVPAAGQGALGIETRADDAELRELLGALHHLTTHAEVTAERTVLARLEGGCQIPLGARALHDNGRLRLTAMVASVDGTKVLRTAREGAASDPVALGEAAAEDLRAQGADELIGALR